MVTPAGYVGAVFTLLLSIGCAFGAVAMATSNVDADASKIVGGVVTLSLISVVAGGVVVTNDWPRIWKPLLTGSKK